MPPSSHATTPRSRYILHCCSALVTKLLCQIDEHPIVLAHAMEHSATVACPVAPMKSAPTKSPSEINGASQSTELGDMVGASWAAATARASSQEAIATAATVTVSGVAPARANMRTIVGFRSDLFLQRARTHTYTPPPPPG